MRTWVAICGFAAATALLAAGGSSALWGRPQSILTPWQRAMLGTPREQEVITSLQQQIVRLNTENVMLRSRLDQYAQIQGEGGFPPARVVVARGRVVGRTTRVSRRFLELDVGTDDGVVRDLPVCAGWSLAGMIAGVREGRCLVQELGDSESRIPATVMDGRKLIAEGVLVGTGVPGRARLDYIEPRDDLRIDPGMHVVTAGSDGRLPPGLVLGQIATAMRGSGAEHWRLDVTLAADASTAESLLVMRVPNAPAQPAPAPAADEATAAP